MSRDTAESLSQRIEDYRVFIRRGARFWKRALVVVVLVTAVGSFWIVRKTRVFKSEANAAVQEVIGDANRPGLSTDEAQAELRARLDQIYTSHANLGRVIDELQLYPWLRGQTSRFKTTEVFREALSYGGAGRDAFHIEFIYRDPAVARRVVERMLRLYTEERRTAGQSVARNELSSVDTALAGLEIVLSEQEERLERFETVNSEMVEKVRLRRTGQFEAGHRSGAGIRQKPFASVQNEPGDSHPVRRLRLRLAAAQSRYVALQRMIEAQTDGLTPLSSALRGATEESEHTASLRSAVSELRDRLARLRTAYTDEYPDVQITLRRLGEAERDLRVALAANRAHAQGVMVGSSERIQVQLASASRDLEQTRAALAAMVRKDRAASAAAPVRLVLASPAVGAGHAAGRVLTSLVEVESTWDQFNAGLATTRNRYQQLLTRKFELQAVLDTVKTTGADVLRVIDPASLPVEPEPPGRTYLAMIVLAAALALGLGVAGLSGVLDSRLYELADLRRWGEVPGLAAIPDLHEQSVLDTFFSRRAG